MHCNVNILEDLPTPAACRTGDVRSPRKVGKAGSSFAPSAQLPVAGQRGRSGARSVGHLTWGAMAESSLDVNSIAQRDVGSSAGGTLASQDSASDRAVEGDTDSDWGMIWTVAIVIIATVILC